MIGRKTALYVAMLLAAVGLFLLIRQRGEALTPAAAATLPADPTRKPEALPHVLLALAAVIFAGKLLGRAFTSIGQPPVIGEVVAGILLGPSLLGRVWPAGMAWLLPPGVAPFLGVIAQIGVILYMFLVGLELNLDRLRARAAQTVAVAHAGISLPFVLGAGLALPLFRPLAPPGVPFTSFALFLGVSLSVTAFPVLARVLSDRGLTKTDLGVMALGCAAVGDVTAWCLLALVVGVAQAQPGNAVLVTALSAGFVALMFLVVRPVAVRVASRYRDALPPELLAGILVSVLLSALATEAIGIHAVFGAFLLGAVIPHDSAIARVFPHKLEDVVTTLFLPAFFAFTGLRTQIGLVAGWDNWLICGGIILTATIGKFGGTLLAARLTGQGWRGSAALGVLMNTRGLMELIVLNIGLDLGVISPTLFAMMVLMALITTMATAPLLRALHADPREPRVPAADDPGAFAKPVTVS
ncbi:MAG: cation:proton antiporter [Gemmataceae bacterium]